MPSGTPVAAVDGLHTFPRLLFHHARIRPDAPAMREKYLGIWQTWTWGEVAERVRARDPKRIIAAHQQEDTPEPGSDAEYYARFKVPDDLDW